MSQNFKEPTQERTLDKVVDMLERLRQREAELLDRFEQAKQNLRVVDPVPWLRQRLRRREPPLPMPELPPLVKQNFKEPIVDPVPWLKDPNFKEPIQEEVVVGRLERLRQREAELLDRFEKSKQHRLGTRRLVPA
jgi:hypothetical protein